MGLASMPAMGYRWRFPEIPPRKTRSVSFPITHSILDARAVGELATAFFGLKGPWHCELLTRGMNDVYMIRNADTRYALRAWRAGLHSDAAVRFELHFLKHLRAAGIPVVTGIPAPNGEFFTAVDAPEGRRQIAMFGWAGGVTLAQQPDVERARRLGAEIARIHLAGRNFTGEEPRPFGFDRNIRNKMHFLTERLADRPDDAKFYEKAGQAILAAMVRVQPSLPAGPIHGDIHARNAFFEDGKIQILDFDTCGEAPWLHDVTCFVWANAYIAFENPGLRNGIAEAFVAGYESVRPFTAAEKDAWALWTAAKELSYLCGMSGVVNVVGPASTRNVSWDWFRESVQQHVAEAGLRV